MYYKFIKGKGGKYMKNYTLRASIGQQVTTVAIKARDNFGAKVMSAIKISACAVADKRWGKGEIILLDPENKQVMKIKQEE